MSTVQSSDSRLKLHRIYINNYKCMSEFDMPFGDFTLLLGKNGCGKSTVFDVIYNLHCFVCREGRVGELFPFSSLDRRKPLVRRRSLVRRRHQVRRSTAGDMQTFRLEVKGKDGIFSYCLIIAHDIDFKKSWVYSEELSLDAKPLFAFKHGVVQLYHDDHSEGHQYPFHWNSSALIPIAESEDNTRLVAFRQWMRGVAKLAPNPIGMSALSDSDGDNYFHANGENFASWFRDLSMKEPQRVAKVEERLQDLLPRYANLSMSELVNDTYRILHANFTMPSQKVRYRFDELSLGQRTLIALYMIIFGDNPNRILLLDEPDNFVMLQEIQPLLSEMEDESGDELPQIALISHHPEAMDFISEADKAWLVMDDDGSVRVGEFENDTNMTISELCMRKMTP